VSDIASSSSSAADVTFPAYETPRAVAGSTLASVVLCENPSAMTMEGTNSVILRAPGSRTSVVIDPGPSDAAHAEALARAAGEVELVLVTHRHGDHTDGIDGFAALAPAPVRAALPEHCRGGETLDDGEVIRAAGLHIGVLATPGHTADSVSFVVAADSPGVGSGVGEGEGADCIVLGDTILGRDSTVLDATDGSLASYLDSLEGIRGVAGDRALPGVPGHGPDIADTAAAATGLAEHRQARLQQVRDAVAELGPDASAEELTRHIYTEVTDSTLLAAAEQSTRVALGYIAERG